MSKLRTPSPKPGAPRQSEDWEEDKPYLPSLTVYDDGPTFTGILDQNGQQIMRDKPIGFLSSINHRKR